MFTEEIFPVDQVGWMFLWTPGTEWPKGSGWQKCLQPFESPVKEAGPVGNGESEASASCPSSGR